MPGPFLAPGTTKWYYLASIASGTKAPTVAEIAAGTHLTDPAEANNILVNVDGFDSESTFVTVEPYSSLQTLKIVGRQNSNDSSMDFTEDVGGTNPKKTLFARGTAGFIVEAPIGVVTAGAKVHSYPILVGANNPIRGALNEPRRFKVAFSITGIPAQDIAVLA